ncbi:MAG TPA: helix-turn-helix domain-containing protein [Nitrososphaerales archaeon]|nr:helix-turn-helix domain-containing protein [Nitrososphaerales archaeon]
MSSSDELIDLFQVLGLNLYESKAYLTLIVKGQISARDLGHLTTIPQSRTYDVLSSLKDKGFALTTPSSDRSYVPSEPKQTLLALYGKRKKEIQHQVIKIQEEIEKKLESLHESYSKALDKVSSLTSEQTQVMNQPVFVVEGNQNIENAMVSMIDRAEKEFLRITKPSESNKSVLDPFYFTSGRTIGHLETARKRGVELRTLSLLHEIPTLFGLKVPADDVVDRKYLEKADDIQEKFILIDNHVALLNLRDPVSKTFGSIGLMLESDPTCSILKQHFQSMWDRAESRASAVKRMKQATEEVCEAMKESKFDRLDISVYRWLATNGATERETLVRSFSRTRRNPTEIHAGIERLLRHKLITKNEALHVLMVENPLKAKSLI